MLHLSFSEPCAWRRQTQQLDLAFLSELEPSLSAGMRRIIEIEIRNVVETEMREMMVQLKKATLDILSPMHAETEGNEPSPSVQLCKFKNENYEGKQLSTKNTRDKTKRKCATEEECSCLVCKDSMQLT